MTFTNCLLALVFLVLSAPMAASESTTDIGAKGTLRPDGPPQQRPIRTDAGKSCVVDVIQGYIVDGTLSGSFEIDFRILVAGPCGSPLGTYDEKWIARGNFSGTVDGGPASASFTYTASVHAGGEVNGRIVLGHGIDGELRVNGNFGDGELTYDERLITKSQE